MVTEKTLQKEIFISFSGRKSKEIAFALKKWLSLIFREVEFVVSADIPKGNFWIDNLNKHLRLSIAGILCVTRDNYQEPWLMFEAGALMTKHEQGCQAIPFVLDEKPDEIIAFLQNTPLSVVQTTSYRVKSGEKPSDKKLSEAEENREELCRMVLEIHRALQSQERESDLELYLKNQYEYLENALQRIADKYPDEPPSNAQDMVTQALLAYVERFEQTFAAAMEQDKQDKQNKQRQNERLEEIQGTVQSSLLLLGDVLSAITDKGSGHEEQLSEFGERLKRMEIGLNQSMEVRQWIAFHMGLIHERFPAVLSGLDISSGFAPLDTEFSDYHKNAKTYVTRVREEIFSCLNGNILMSLDSVTESISRTETALNAILEAVRTLLLSKGAVIPDNTQILNKITLSQTSLNDIQKVRESLLKVRHGEISI